MPAVRSRSPFATAGSRSPTGVPASTPSDLPRVFDRFYRALDARSRPGSGLGLAIVSDVVEGHGGSVLASARDGGGATVGFVLPLQDG